MTICASCGAPFLDCCEDRTLCASCLKESVKQKVREFESKEHPKFREG